MTRRIVCALIGAVALTACTSGSREAGSPGSSTPDSASVAPGSTRRSIALGEVGRFEATVAVTGGARSTRRGRVTCTESRDGLVLDFESFRLTLPDGRDRDGTLTLRSGEQEIGSGSGRIDARAATADGRDAIEFGFSASYRAGTQTGTMEGTGSCVIEVDPGGTRSTTTAPPTSSTRAADTGEIRVEAPTDDAERLTRRLVTLAEGAAGEPAWPVARRWTDAGLPPDAVVGAAVIVDGTTTVVSGFQAVEHKETGGTYVAFAVAARNGSCWYAYVAASGGRPTGEARKASGACRGQDAAAAFGLS